MTKIKKPLTKKTDHELRSVTDIKAEIATYTEKAEQILERGISEKRELKEEETRELRELNYKAQKNQIELLKTEIQERNVVQSAEPAAKPSNLVQIIRSLSNGSMTEEMQELNERGLANLKGSKLPGDKVEGRMMSICLPCTTQIEKRAEGDPLIVGAPGSLTGYNTVETQRQPLLAPLTDSLVLSQLGITSLTGLTGNVAFPAITAIKAGWKGEIEAAYKSGPEFPDPIEFSPRRLTSEIVVSDQLLNQSSEDINTLLIEMIQDAIRQTLEDTLLGSDAATTNKPAGIFHDVVASNKPLNYRRVIDFEKELIKNNALKGNLGFVTNPDVYATGQLTLKSNVAGARYVIEDGKINEYPIVRSNKVPTISGEGGVVFGNWKDFFLGQWDAVKLTVDPYSLASNSEIKIIITSYFDGGVIRKASFIKGTALDSEILPENVTLNKNTATLAVGEETQLIATLAPQTTTNTYVSWKSSKLTVAKVATDGTVIGIGAGTATITATTVNGKTATASITVTAE